ncbi:hypothetical protein Tco_1010370, partial [Tanacetum coccineum]
KRDTAYRRQLFTRKRVQPIPNMAYSSSAICRFNVSSRVADIRRKKARRQGRTFNWKTDTYGKMEYYENKDDSFMDLETEYPAIVFDDTSNVAFSREPTVGGWVRLYVANDGGAFWDDDGGVAREVVVFEAFEWWFNGGEDKLTSGDKSLDLSAFKLSRLFFSLLSSGSSSCWRSYGAQ